MKANKIERARQSLLRRGWTQGRQRNRDTGEMCIMGALRRVGVRAESTEEAELTGIIVDVVNEQFPNPLSGWCSGRGAIVLFNDQGGRSFADVDMVLDKAARRLEERA